MKNVRTVRKGLVTAAVAALAVLAVAAPAGSLPAQILGAQNGIIVEASAAGTTWTTLTKFSQLKSAVNRGADHIRLKGNVEMTETLTVRDNITIDLNGYKLSCKGNFRAFDNRGTLTITDNTTRQNGKLTGGTADEGGAIYNDGTLYILAGTIEGCDANNGGAIYNASGSDLIISGGAIRNNSASGNGGAIYAESSSVIQFDGVGALTDNSALNGGAVYAEKNATIIVESESRIEDNDASGFGGGIYSEGAKITIDGGSISGNTASRRGGGIYEDASASKVTVESGNFSGNSPADFTNSDGKSFKKGTLTVTFIHNNTSKNVSVTWGSSVSSPSFNGKTYTDWYLNGRKFDLKTAITEDITLTNNTADTAYVGSWNELCTALANGGDIILTRNIIASGSTNPKVPSGVTAKLDLNGNSISGGTNRYNTINNFGDLTITDSSRSRNGFISNNSNASSDNIIYNDGKLTLSYVKLYTPYSYLSSNNAISNSRYGTVDISESVIMGNINNAGSRNSVVVYSGNVTGTDGYTISNNSYYYVNYDSSIGSYYKTQAVIGRGRTAVDYGDIPASRTTENGRNQFQGWYLNGGRYNFNNTVTNSFTLTAQWSNTEIRVYFDGNGGNAPTSYTMRSGDTLGNLPTPTRTGYTFRGWTLNGQYVSSTTKLYNDSTLVAQWEKQQTRYITVTLRTETGRVFDTVKVEAGKAIGALRAPVQTGYVFKGWFYGATLVDNYSVFYEDVDLYPVFEQEERYCTVTLRADGGLYDTVTVKAGSYLGALPAPYKDGYEFLGWKLNGSFVDNYTVINNDCTLTAEWRETATYYTVDIYLTLDDVAYSAPLTTKTIKSGDALGTMPNVSNVGMAGYTFIGWMSGGGYVDASTKVYSNMVIYGDWFDDSTGSDFLSDDMYWDDGGYYGGAYGNSIDSASEDGEYSAENSDEADTSGIDINNIAVDSGAEVTSASAKAGSDNPKTGVEDAAGAAGLASIFAGLAFIFRKKRS